MRVVQRARSLRAWPRAVRASLSASTAELSQLRTEVRGLHEETARLGARLDTGLGALDPERTRRILQALHDAEEEHRRRVAELRETPAYAAAYDEADPLVSVIIPTYRNVTALRDRALPSVLAQSHANLEVVVVGDAAPPETAEAIAALGDDRVRYFNLPVRGSYPDDPHERWLVSGSVPFNEALRRVTGRWIAPFADDDALRPGTVERMLDHVRGNRLEGAYGVLHCVPPHGEPFLIGQYPPREGGLGLQGALFHAGLRFFEQRLSDALFDLPNDWAMLRRMLRAGVRFGFLDEVVCDYFPSTVVPPARGELP